MQNIQPKVSKISKERRDNFFISINAQVAEKESARNAIEQKATQQTQFINNNDNATDEEKEVANNLVIATKQKSLDNINSLSSNSDVENAKVAGINEIANVLPATAVKSQAKRY